MRSVRSVKPHILTIFNSNRYIYAQIQRQIDGHIVAAASTVEKDLRTELASTSDKQVRCCQRTFMFATCICWRQNGVFFFAKQASARVGKLLAERAQQQGVPAVHWERKYGQKFHGKVKELLVSMQEAGLPLS